MNPWRPWEDRDLRFPVAWFVFAFTGRTPIRWVHIAGIRWAALMHLGPGWDWSRYQAGVNVSSGPGGQLSGGHDGRGHGGQRRHD